MVCKNCDNNFLGNFCNNCGQNAKVGKINFKYVMNEISGSILQLNKGYLFTVKELFIRPGYCIRSFIEGKRSSYYKPLAFFLVSSTIYILIRYLLGKNTYIEDVIQGYFNASSGNSANSSSDVVNWIIEHQIYIALTFLPLFTIGSYLSFIKSRYNFYEHFVLNLYIAGQQMLILLLSGFFILKDNYIEVIPILLIMIYGCWVFNQFFNDKKLFIRVLLIFLTYLIFFFEIVLIISLLAFIRKLVYV